MNFMKENNNYFKAPHCYCVSCLFLDFELVSILAVADVSFSALIEISIFEIELR